MFRKKNVAVIFAFLAVNFLPAQEIEKTLYRDTTLVEYDKIKWDASDMRIEYYKADVRFVDSYTAWGELYWEVEAPDLRLVGFEMLPAPDLPTPEKEKIITVFFRMVPGRGSVIDYWMTAENQPVEVTVERQQIDRTMYRISTLWEAANRSANGGPSPGIVEYFEVAVRFQRPSLGWGTDHEGELRWKIGYIGGTPVQVDALPAPGLPMPERGKDITVFVRNTPDKGMVIDDWIYTKP